MRGSTADLIRPKRALVSLKKGHLKLSSQRSKERKKNEEKQRELKGCIGHYQAHQHTHNGKESQKENREKGAKSFYEEIMAESFPTLKKAMDREIQED